MRLYLILAPSRTGGSATILDFCKKNFFTTWAQITSNMGKIDEALKMVYSIALTYLTKNMVLVPIGVALYYGRQKKWRF
jgi:hypothetical protein